ncbi:MAG: cation:proton antiporter [Sphingobacteriia bacterium]|nr:cation:proton antiporter [Sphingobacteriia bacterium]
MFSYSAEMILLVLSITVIVSYMFSILSKYIRIPSVLMLLALGIGLRFWTDTYQIKPLIPPVITEFLGIAGLVMIILEAGLDLKLTKSKIPVISQSFFSALIIFFLGLTGITTIFYYFLQEPLLQCIIYAIPLSIMSSAIVIPSLHQLTDAKKEFLVYEASFSDIIGILVFNYFIEGEILSAISIGGFFVKIVIAIILSVLLSVLMFVILNKARLNIRFFLVFALLIALYVGGKLLHLPSLIVILVFGLLMNNWQLVEGKSKRFGKYFSSNEVAETTHFLHSITAESSFLLRTFFFVMFGYSINLQSLVNNNILLVGSLIIVVLLITRYVYLKFFVKERVYPEVVFIPRGLITVLLFYKIPQQYKLQNFDEGILFFVILASSLILMIGMLFYKQPSSSIQEENL